VLVRFPFSDLSFMKLRPALVLADAGRGDWVLCQITSNPYADALAVPLEDSDFVEGSLQRVSFVRPGKLFTANASVMEAIAGSLKPEKHRRVVDAVVRLIAGEG
jgi:mRNA interferase MazF